MQSLKDLIPGMMRRHQITEQVTTARILDVVNEAIQPMLPPGRAQDARAAFVRDGVVLVACLNASAASFIGSREAALIDEVKRRLPTARVDRIRTRIGV